MIEKIEPTAVTVVYDPLEDPHKRGMFEFGRAHNKPMFHYAVFVDKDEFRPIHIWAQSVHDMLVHMLANHSEHRIDRWQSYFDGVETNERNKELFLEQVKLQHQKQR